MARSGLDEAIERTLVDGLAHCKALFPGNRQGTDHDVTLLSRTCCTLSCMLLALHEKTEQHEKVKDT